MKVTLDDVKKMNADDILFVDIRGKISYMHGHILGAIEIDDLTDKYKDKKLIVYCAYGKNSERVVDKLNNQGYEAYELAEGYRAWLINEFDSLSPDETNRYDRQIILPEIGIEGQRKLKNARVLIVGVGGLGAPAALYLAGAGVGEIGLIDADVVGVSNLQRQIIHDIDSVGINKALSGKRKIEALNNMVKVNTYTDYITTDNIEKIIGDYDFIVEASDNFQTKFLINDACVLMKKAFCHAGSIGFEGQVMTYVPGKGPCYRCIFEDIPEDENIPNCETAGIMGAVTGVIGSIQALEAIKYITGIGQLLIGRIYIFDGLSMSSRIVNINNKNSACRVCGTDPDITDIKWNEDYYRMRICKF